MNYQKKDIYKKAIVSTQARHLNGIRAMDKKRGISRKLRKIRRKLNKLYPEYKQLNITKTDNDKLDQLIDNISNIEYKYIQYLKIQ